MGFSWDGSTGNWAIYADGVLVDSTALSGGTLLANGRTIDGGGVLLFGQEQDSVGSGFSDTQEFSGTLFNTRLFSDVRTDAEMSASHRSELPHDEAGMLAQWTFDALSVDGIITDTVSGNNLTVRHTSEVGFTPSLASLTFAVDENALDGTVVGSVSGVDPQREARISALLAADPDLVYNAEVGKFYTLSSSQFIYSSAESAAVSNTLNGVSGQLVTVANAAEQAFLTDHANGSAFWLGATDTTVEGEWRWQDAGTDSRMFWYGDATGYANAGSYSNWLNGQPDGSGDVARVRSDGNWDDQATGDDLYITEWDADDVLDTTQALTYSVVSQTVSGAFAIDSDNGTIIVADGSLLDFESNTTHTINVRTTDVDNNTHDEAFTVSLNNLLEANNAPTNLSSGIELNIDGGNDAYLIVADGGAIMGGLTETTIEIQFSGLTPTGGSQSIVSYHETTGAAADTTLMILPNGQIHFEPANASVSTSGSYTELFDGDLHTLSVSWYQDTGRIDFYIDGDFKETVIGTTGNIIDGGGTLVIGQEQDAPGSGFDSGEYFSGVLHDVRIWNEVRSETEISLNYQHKFDSGSLPSGLIANWQMDGFNGSNDVVDVVSANNLSVGHAADAGFIASTPVEDLHISENANNGTSIGFVVPSDPDAPQDVIADGLFSEAGTPTFTRYSDGQTFGSWNVTSGTLVDLVNPEASAGWSETPLGGDLIHLWEPQSGVTNSIEQTFATEAGKQYQVVLAASGNFEGNTEVKTLRVAVDGQSTDQVFGEVPTGWATDNILWDHRSFTFTADDNTATLSFEDRSFDASKGTVIADVRVIEIPQAVTTILNNDPTLSYDVATGKFYRHVETNALWTGAFDAATGSDLNGVSGQLVTIDSAYENSVVRNFAMADNRSGVWLGASDENVEGQWRWYDGSSEAELFWQGDGSGSAEPGSFTNWKAGQPNNVGSFQHYAIIGSDGQWDDYSNGNFYGYVIEWDASEVLSNFTFSLTDDAGGRFAVESNTGEITIADGSLLDYETATTHNVDVDVTDAGGNTYTETTTIAVDNSIDANQTVPAAQTINEDTTLTFVSGTATEVSVTDSVSAINSLMRITVSVNDGVLNLAQTTGLSFIEGSDGSGSFVIDGTESDINAALDGMTFTPHANFNRSVLLNMTTALAADLDGHFTFDGGPGDQSAGITYNGTLNGNATIATDAERGQVLTLDGDGDYVQIDGLMGEPADVTLSAWINATSVDTSGAVVISMGTSPALYLHTDGTLFGYYESGGTFNVAQSTESLVGTGWRHVAVSIDSANSMTIFIDGVAANNITPVGAMEYDNSPDTYIGRAGDGLGDFDFNGMIDDARVYSRALSADEIASLAADHADAYNSVAITIDAINDAPVFAVPGEAIFTEGDWGYGQNQDSLALSDGSMIITPYDSGGDSVLVKLNSDGTIDTSFGNSGYADNGMIGYIESVALQADGKILVSGNISGNIFLARYNANGTIDSGFGSSGVISLPTGTSDEGNGISVQSDGSIVLVGEYGDDSFIARFTSSGALDGGFGSGGIATVNLAGTFENLEDVSVLADGSIIAVGETHVVKLDSGGTPDGGFGTAGILNLGDNTIGVTVQTDGKFVVVGGDGTALFATRFNADGSNDTDFGTSGTAFWSTVAATGYSVVQQSDGKLVVAGSTDAYPSQWVAARFNVDGSIDTSFGDNGAWVQTTSTDFSEAYSVSLYHDGTSEKIVIGGYTTRDGFGNSTYSTMVRLTHSGAIDTVLGTNTLDGNPTYVENGTAVVLDTDVLIFDIELSDSDDFSDSTLTIERNGGANSDDVFSTTGNLSFVGTTTGNIDLSPSGVIGTYSNIGGALVLTFAGGATNAQVNEVMRSITYSNNSDLPPASVQLDWTFDDGNSGTQGTGDAQSVVGSTTVDITAINDDPTNTGSQPTDINVTEDVASNVDLSLIDFSDADAGSSSLTVTLTTGTGGELTVVAGTGITLGGTATARTFTGTLTDLNTYFDTASNIQYLHGTPGTNGDDADTIQINVNDNGNTGSGGGTDIDLGTVNVDIAAANNAPTFNAATPPSLHREHHKHHR